MHVQQVNMLDKVAHHIVREAYRLNRANIDVGYDIVIVARPSSKDKKCQDIESALMHLCGLKKISHIG